MTAKKTKAPAVAVRVPQDQAEAAAAVARIGELNRQVARLEADMNDEIATLKTAAEAKSVPLKAQVRALSDGVQVWAEANRRAITDGDKVKFADLGTGKVSWRQRPPGVSIRKVEEVIAALKRLGLQRFIRIKEEPNTNTPNLTLTALNRSAEQNRESPEDTLDLAQQLRTALGLAADASDDAIIAACKEAKAANRSVDLTSYAPRADLDAALNRATTAEGELATLKTAGQEAKITAALDKAQAEGKITPASRPEYLAMCKATGGLESFERLAATLPVITGAASTGAGAKPGDAGAVTAASLTDEQRAVCKALGQDEGEFAKSLSTEQKAA
jgi:phage host-nuclease inhibitor protein Gam